MNSFWLRFLDLRMRPGLSLGESLKALSLVVAVTLFVFLGIAEFAAPNIELTLKAKKISHLEGHAFTVGIRDTVTFPYEFRGDDGRRGTASTLRLFEEGRELGPAHRSHEKIRRIGKGAFQHWNRELYFSSSDGSDPRSNGYRYTVHGVARVIPGLWACSGLLLFLGWMVSSGFRHSVLICATTGIRRVHISGTSLALVTGGAIITGVVSLGYQWYSGNSDWLGISGFLPVSDANNYWQCAVLLQDGKAIWASNIADWCGRRVIYPSMLSTLLSVTGWNFWATLLAQSIIVSLSIASLSVAYYPWTGRFGAVLVYCLLFVFASQYAFGVVMTEVPGMAFGCCAISLLVSGSMVASRRQIFLGLAFMSLALVARAGAMVVIPSLFLWAMWVLWHKHRKLIAGAFGLLVALVSGFAWQWLLLFLQGRDSSATFGNFSTTLYRLSKGGETWAEAYADHPELFDAKTPESVAFRAIYRIALQNIQEQPGVLLATYWREIQRYIPEMASLGFEGPVGALVCFLFLCGFYVCIKQWRASWASLLLAICIPEILVGPLLFADGGERIFAATIGGRVVLVAVGAVAVMKGFPLRGARLTQTPYLEKRMFISGERFCSSLATWLGGFIVLTTLLPHTQALGFAKLLPLRVPQSCESPYETNLLRLDKESISFGILNSGKSSIMPLRVDASRVREGLPNDWYADDFRDTEPPTLLIHGIDRSGNSLGGRVRYLVWKGEMPKGDRLVLACVDPNEALGFAGTSYSVIKKLIEL